MIRRDIGVGLKIYKADNSDHYYVDLLHFFTNVESARAYAQELREEFPAVEVFYRPFYSRV